MTAEDFLNGQILLVDKPLDWTSFQAVNKLKYKLKREFNLPKKFKIGHAGTLDPRATGLLIVCTGKFTKKIPEIQDAPKEYWAEIKIGVQTESYDTEKPEILQTDFSHITEEFIKEALTKFVGEIEQKPPVFSAIKIDGDRAYDLARKGIDVEMKSRKTTIHYLNNVEINLPFVSFTVVSTFGFSQQNRNQNQGIYWSTDAQLAYGLGKAVADIINEDNNVDFNANVGLTSVVGFQPISRIGLGAGFALTKSDVRNARLYTLGIGDQNSINKITA
ncbi:hypothetical protein Lal_00042802 [Lupinus albus]|nr:hypothetical protein Lal_00042802 [Lupinus albus]